MLGLIGTFLKARVVAVRHIWRALSISFVNQAVSSATNFLLAVFFVRFMDSAEFGVYGIAIAGVLLFSGVGNALFLTQMVVHLPDKAPHDRPAYLGRHLLMVLALALVAMVLVGGAYAVGRAWAGSDLKPLLVAGVAAAAYLTKDYFLRLSYSLRREATALAINLGVAVVTISMLALVWWRHPRLDATTAIGIYAVGQIAGVCMGLLLCRSAIRIQGLDALPEDLRDSFAGGRWALGGMFVAWLQSQAYVYLTAAFIGPVGVGYANAARVFVSPVQMIMPAINQVTMPRLATLRSEGSARVAAAGRSLTGVVFLSGFAYVCLLVLLYPTAAGFLLADKYHGLGMLVAAWCGVVLVQLLRDGASTIMQTLRKFRRLTISGAAVACLSVPVAAAGAKAFGPVGAVSAMAVAELALAIVLWTWIGRHADSH